MTLQTVIGKDRIALSIAEAAQKLGVSRPFLRLEIRRGRLRAAKAGRRVLVPLGSIDEWLHAAMFDRSPNDARQPRGPSRAQIPTV